MVDAFVTRKGWLAGAIGLALTIGCRPSMIDAAHARAVNDLGCPTEVIRVYNAAGGMVVARGCGHWVRYACYRQEDDAVCVADRPATQMPDDPGYE